MVKLARPVS